MLALAEPRRDSISKGTARFQTAPKAADQCSSQLKGASSTTISPMSERAQQPTSQASIDSKATTFSFQLSADSSGRHVPEKALQASVAAEQSQRSGRNAYQIPTGSKSAAVALVPGSDLHSTDAALQDLGPFSGRAALHDLDLHDEQVSLFCPSNLSPSPSSDHLTPPGQQGNISTDSQLAIVAGCL